MKATLIKTDNSVTEIEPENGKRFELKELQNYVDGLIGLVEFPDGRTIVVNKEGKVEGLPVNELATALWLEQFPLKKYPDNNDGPVVGDAVILPKGYYDDEA